MQRKEITKTYLYFDSDSKKDFMEWLWYKKLNLGEASDLLNVSPAYLSLVINGKREVTERLQKELKKIGYEM